MTILNQDYNPAWEAVHDYHHGQRTRLQNDIDAWHQNHSSSSGRNDELNKLEKERDFHHQTCLRCLDSYQHKTVREFVQWAFKNSENLAEILEQDYAAHISFDHCQTIDQAKVIISQLYKLQAKDNFLNNKAGGKSCPAGQPDGLDIFDRTGANTMTTEWMNFKTRCAFGSSGKDDFIVLTSVDTRENEKHVCFYADQDKSRNAMLIMPRIGQLAFQFIANDLGNDFDEFAKAQAQKAGFSIARLLRKQRSFPAYHFYTHTFMSGDALPREDFIKHILAYDNQDTYQPGSQSYGCFQRVKMKPYKYVPQYLKDAVNRYIGFEEICIHE
ncbi:MAG: hypothetical protein H6869_01815 [Rhodospirillales bacterium]|nr:hypothetical protein [Rhodospirillales bacterium]